MLDYDNNMFSSNELNNNDRIYYNKINIIY